ncbi:MAG: hypothetical protein LBF68_07255 [Christensenellaceae bacterium]|jgi:4-diphosphocytidyl-2-C-methyl-D-erythritol kinase|nr:hypothetical protein [Christensenellaceae bacterium]
MEKPTGNFAEIKVFAKVNLALNISGINGLGYHTLDTIITRVPVFDVIKVTLRTDSLVNIKYDTGVSYINDTALKAARFLIDKYNLPGADIQIVKHIPESAGLGGSSADAAGVFLAYKKLFNFELDNMELIKIGSDIPSMMQHGDLLLSGVGETIKHILLDNYYGIILINQDLKVSTREVYDCYDKVGGSQWDVKRFFRGVLEFSNSLEKAAMILSPQISELRKTLEDQEFEHVVMTGSGSGMVGFSTSKTLRDRAFTVLKKKVNRHSQMLIISFETEE